MKISWNRNNIDVFFYTLASPHFDNDNADTSLERIRIYETPCVRKHGDSHFIRTQQLKFKPIFSFNEIKICFQKRYNRVIVRPNACTRQNPPRMSETDTIYRRRENF
jgi:hypothetical protein